MKRIFQNVVVNLCAAIIFVLVFNVDTNAYNVPDGFVQVKSAPGVVLYKRDYPGACFIQVINLSQGASFKLLHGSITDPGYGGGVYGGDNPSFTRQTVQQIWSDFSSSYNNVFSITNGQFFDPNRNPTPLAFPLKVNGNIVSDGYGIDEYINQKLMFELWSGHADIQPLTGNNLHNSSALDILAGLSEDADKGLNVNNKRTFLGIIDDNSDAYFETILIFNSTDVTQYAAAQVLRDFGASKVIMFDGGGSTQMICDGYTYIASSRLIPQSIAVL